MFAGALEPLSDDLLDAPRDRFNTGRPANADYIDGCKAAVWRVIQNDPSLTGGQPARIEELMGYYAKEYHPVAVLLAAGQEIPEELQAKLAGITRRLNVAFAEEGLGERRLETLKEIVHNIPLEPQISARVGIKGAACSIAAR